MGFLSSSPLDKLELCWQVYVWLGTAILPGKLCSRSIALHHALAPAVGCRLLRTNQPGDWASDPS